MGNRKLNIVDALASSLVNMAVREDGEKFIVAYFNGTQIIGETRVKLPTTLTNPIIATDSELIGHDDWEGMPF